jgi:hypothetical protein
VFGHVIGIIELLKQLVTVNNYDSLTQLKPLRFTVNTMHTKSSQYSVHTAEPLVPGPSRLEAEIAIGQLKRYKSPGSDQIPAELIQAGGEILLSAIHKLINSVWNKEELPDQWKESIIVPIHKKTDQTDCNNSHETSLLLTL